MLEPFEEWKAKQEAAGLTVLPDVAPTAADWDPLDKTETVGLVMVGASDDWRSEGLFTRKKEGR